MPATAPDSEPEPIALVANDDAFTLADDSGAMDVLANDQGNGLSVVSVSAPTVGSVELLPDGRVLVTLPESFAGSTSFQYRVVDASGQAASANVVVESGNVLAGVSELVEVNDEPLASVGALLGEIETLYQELIDIRLSAAQTTALVFSPITLGCLYFLFRRNESLMSVTGVRCGTFLPAEQYGHRTKARLRHDQVVWFGGRSRRRNGKREYLIEASDGLRAWVPAENVTDTGH